MGEIEFVVMTEDSFLSRISMSNSIRESGLVMGRCEAATITNDDGSIWGEALLMYCRGLETKYEQFKTLMGLKEVPGLDYKLLAVEVEDEA